MSDPNETPPGVAFAIGRAIGPAVVRNRLRRRLRAVLTRAAQRNAIPPGLLLVGGTPQLLELTFEQLEDEVQTLLSSLR